MQAARRLPTSDKGQGSGLPTPRRRTLSQGRMNEAEEGEDYRKGDVKQVRRYEGRKEGRKECK
jgi:hypothetical protein